MDLFSSYLPLNWNSKYTPLQTTNTLSCALLNLQIVDADSLWMWSRETLIPGLYGGEWYNGEKIQKGFLANTEDYLVGIPRVRLLRVEKG
jgi:hypothetical protein